MSSTTDPGNRSAAEIERDVERMRDRLRDTLEALRDRASPGQIFEQVMDYAKESGAPEMMRNMGRAMRDNPMPLVLIGAGIAWMMFSESPRRGDNRSYDRGDDHDRGRRWDADQDGRRRMARMRDEGEGMMTRASQAAGEAASSIRDTVSEAAGRAGEMASGMMDSARETAGQVGDMASSAYRRVTGAAGSATDMSGMTEGARRYAMEARGQADRGMRWMLDEQPLLLGALGLAVGAAVGALIPSTEMEDRLMGETRDDLVGRVRETAEEAYEGAKDKAQGLMGEAGEKAGAAGGGIAESVRNAAHSARESVTQAAKEMADQAKSALHEAGRGDEPNRPENAPGATPNRTQPARPGGAS